ncbi:HaeII family restriction endonuclease [Blautia obeum]|uniref:HaeII family restriction endonuclease n=1 Tax=Blautia obeum TaxID=40520 RepID=A0A411ZSU4_9FIRM|nr:HaeII family restriction endonuclease [Blautia obeum]
MCTESELIDWYYKALKGKYSDILGENLIVTLCEEISNEFPSVFDMLEILKHRHYENIKDEF